MAFNFSRPIGVFQSVPYKVNENTDIYVDGGLLCNYPIHAFDGLYMFLLLL